ncbi:mRNA-decapping enzyme subunit 2, partial [Ascosphaera aggregata]
MSQWSPYHHAAAFSEFMAYKTRVPVRGAILLNEEMDKCVLVKGYKKNANWSFPRGKINKDEPDLDCAIREVYEETGFDIRGAGLLTETTEEEYIEIPMREQNMRLYVIRGVSMDTHFEPRTRKEISKIDWYKISDLPAAKRGKRQQQHANDINQSQNQNRNQSENHQQPLPPVPPTKFYMVAPFLSRLKRMIRDYKRNDEKLRGGDANNVQYPSGTEAFTEEEDLPIPSRKRKGGAARTPALSEVPEVRTPLEITAASSTSGDPMATLKQVLSISGAATAAEKREPLLPADNGDKSKTLLGLLKGASASTTNPPPVSVQPPATTGIDHGNTPQTQVPPRQQILPLQGCPFLPPPFSNAPPLHPPFMPAAVPPGQQLPNPLHSSFPPMLPPPHLYNTTVPQPYIPYPASTFSHPSLTLPPPHMPNPLLPLSHLPQLPSPRVQDEAPAQGPASRPYQRTGDPQFAQTEQQRGKGGFASAIPSASKLPPPKLSRHSLGLLSVLRGEAAAATTAVLDKEAEKKEDTRLAVKTGTGNAAGDLLELLKRKPAPMSASASVPTSAAEVTTSGAAIVSVAGNAKQQNGTHVQTESNQTIPPRQHFRGGRNGLGSETEFSDFGRRIGRGGKRFGGLKTASTPDLGKRERERRNQEKEKEGEKMKNVTILLRPQSQPKPQPQPTSQEEKKSTLPPIAPQQPRIHHQQQQLSPHNKPQPFQPQRILKRPDSASPTAVAKPTGLSSSRLPGEMSEVRTFGKSAKYGRPAVPAEP